METQKENKNKEIPPDVERKLGRRYAAFEYISAGATSLVFKAHDQILDKKVAIKILKSPEKRNLIRFQKEAKALSLLEHPNLVTIMDFNVTTENHAYLIMEFLEGLDLETALEKSGPLEVEDALTIARQITSAMIHAHSKNITHRDLKTSNIIVSGMENPQTTVIDFGLAIKHAQDDTQLVEDGLTTTGEGKIQGSPLYMSPEQAQGKEADERSDIYSLACIIFRMVAGRTPFVGDDVMGVLKQHVSSPAPRLSAVCPKRNIAPQLDETLSKMLSKNPDERIQTMERVLKELNPEHDEVKDDGEDKSNEKKFVIPITASTLAFGVAAVFLVIALSLFLLPRKEAKVVKKQRIDILKEHVQAKANLHYKDQEHSLWLQVEESDKFQLQDSDIALLKEVIEEKKVAQKACREAFPAMGDGGGISNYFTRVNLRDTHIDGSSLDSLKDSGVIRLDLSNTKLSKKAFENILELPNLQILVLNNTNVDDNDLKILWPQSKLLEIMFNNSEEVTSEAFEGVEQCNSLKLISCRFGDVTDENKFQRKGPGKVNRKIDDKALLLISKSTSIESLYLDGCAVTDAGFEKYLDHPERANSPLMDLELNACPEITGKTIKLLAEKNPELKKLSIAFIKIDKENFPYLGSFKKLILLNIMGRTLSREEMKVIGQLSSLAFLYVTNVESDESAIEYLLHFDKMQTMIIFNPDLTKRCCRKLEDRYKTRLVIFLNKKAMPEGMHIVEELLK